MRKNNIKDFIDRSVQNKIKDLGYDGMRLELMDACSKFQVNIKLDFKNFKLNEENISNIEDVRSKYLAWYVFYAQKRIIDLFRIERKYSQFGFTPLKDFKLLLFKEKLEGNDK